MRVESNDWRPYGKIVFQKQNYVVKQVAMLPEKAAEYESDPNYVCCPMQSWQYTDLHKLFDEWRKQFQKSTENGICKRIPCICYPDAVAFRSTYLAGLKHSAFMKAMDDNINSGWEKARLAAHDVVTHATKSKDMKEICKAIGYPPFVIAALGKALLKFEDGDAIPLIAKFYEDMVTGILCNPVEKTAELAFLISDKTWEVIDQAEFNY